MKASKRKSFKIFIQFCIIFSLFIPHFSLLNAQWISYQLPYTGIAYTIGFYNLSTGVSLGHNFYNGKIFYTKNSGVSWINSTYPSEIRSIADVQFINTTTVYACGAENLTNENKYNISADFPNLPQNLREKFLREGKRESAFIYKGLFIKSTNSGVSWQKVGHIDTTTGYMNDINFFNANTGYALIDSGSYGYTKFYKTTNAGNNWQPVCLIDSSTIVLKMIFFNLNTGIAMGFNAGGRIYKTTNGGLKWNKTIMPTQIDGITFFNSTTGIAIGIAGGLSSYNVYRTTNTGNNWILISTVNGTRYFENLQSLQNTGIAFAAGELADSVFNLSKISTMKTTNFGTSWSVKDFNPAIVATGISLIDQNNFFISGGFLETPAMILKSTNGGNVFVNQIGNIIPESFSLEQNYPNPFNPTTKISYKVKSYKVIKLVVYDILGKELTILVDEKLQPGKYEVLFDGSRFPSGIFYYSLFVNGERIDTKKMLLIK